MTASSHQFAVQGRKRRTAEMTRAGHTASEIAGRLGVTVRTVVRDRAEMGVAQKPSRIEWTADMAATADALVGDGAPLAEVARTLGVSVKVIYRRYSAKTRGRR